MPTFAAKDCFSPVIGLTNDFVHRVFTCPECKTDVTVSRFQVEGELAIMCTRCNLRYNVKGEQVLDENQAREFYLERHEGGKPTQQNLGYKVFMRLDATQKVTAVPKDSFINVMKPPAPKPVPAVPVATAPKPAVAPEVAPPSA